VGEISGNSQWLRVVSVCALKVVLDTDGVLHAVSVDRHCQYHVDIGETSLASIVSHDLLPAVPGVELLVATADGTLLCLTAGNASQSAASQMSVSVLRELSRVTGWPAELRSHNDFLFTDTVSISYRYMSLKHSPVHVCVCLCVCPHSNTNTTGPNLTGGST